MVALLPYYIDQWSLGRHAGPYCLTLDPTTPRANKEYMELYMAREDMAYDDDDDDGDDDDDDDDDDDGGGDDDDDDE